MAEELSKLGSHPLTGLFPGLRLIGAIRLAFDPRKMVIATLGLILFQTGSSALTGCFPDRPGSRLMSSRAPFGDGPTAWN